MRWLHFLYTDDRMDPKTGFFVLRRYPDKKVEGLDLVFAVTLPWTQLAFVDYRTRVGYTRLRLWLRLGVIIPRRSRLAPKWRRPRGHVYCGASPTEVIGDGYLVYRERSR